MSKLIANLPTKKVWVRKEYLTDFQSGHGEFVEGIWVCAKSIQGRAFYFETYLPDYGAMYDKLPISAFLSSPKIPDPDMDLVNLQFWNCMDYDFTVVVKQFVAPMEWECRTRHFGNQKGQYICTLTTIMVILTKLMRLQVSYQTNISHLTSYNYEMGSFVSIQTTDVASMTPQ